MIKHEIISNSLVDYINSIYSAFEKNFKICKNKADFDAIHDARVSLRKLMSLYTFIYFLNNNKIQSIKNLKKIKKFQKLFSKSRDCQVSLYYATNTDIKNLNNNDFIDYLKSVKLMEEKKLLKNIKNYKTSEILNTREYMINTLLSDINKPILENKLICAVDDSFLNVVEKLLILNFNEIATFHSLRIALKKFRYSLEILDKVTNNHSDRITELKILQDYLGELQDLKVLEDFFEAFILENKETKETLEVIKLKNYIKNKQSELSQGFYNKKFEIHNLWEVTT
jgi:CHAD domain-containing protein